MKLTLIQNPTQTLLVHTQLTLSLCILTFLLSVHVPTAHAFYKTLAADCDGFAKLPMKTAHNSCVGLVLQANTKYPLKMPRKIAQLKMVDATAFVITDMGGWQANKGTLWLLTLTANKQIHLKPLLTKLNLPHGLAVADDGAVYVGEADKISRLYITDVLKGKITQPQVIVANLPAWQGHRHLLSHFIIDRDNNLIVNTGAATDQCKTDIKKGTCQFDINGSKQGSLRKYFYDNKKHTWQPKFQLLAYGLRNSMALAQHASGTVLQAENSMDFKQLSTPYEEINLIEAGKFYGWPYCYDYQQTNPLWQKQGKRLCHVPSAMGNTNNALIYQQPWTVMSPHSAPLDMLYYDGRMFPELNGKLLMSWHGYRATGHRLVYFDVDAKGRPLVVTSASYPVDRANGKTNYQSFYQNGKPIAAAQAHLLISGWQKTSNQPKGAPVGLTVATDGAIWIVDDKNKAILRLAKDNNVQPKKVDISTIQPSTQQDSNKLSAHIAVTNKVVSNILQTHCVQCHVNDLLVTHDATKQLSIPEHWLDDRLGYQPLAYRLFGNAPQPMPPDASLTEQDKQRLKIWLQELNKKDKK